MEYGLRLVTGPTIEPVSLAEIRAHCRVDESADDGLLAGYILAARAYLEATTGLSLVSQTWEMTLEEWPDEDCIELPRQPVQSITSIQYYDTANTLQTLGAGVYEIDVNRFPAEIELTEGSTWPATYDRQAAILVRFVAGYGSAPGSIPEPIRQAILLMVGHFYANREQVVLGAGLTATQLPLGVDALIAPYKVVGF